MIDVESEIYDAIAIATKAQFPNVFISGVYDKTPPSFPYVSLIEADNASYRNTQSSSEMENHAELMYELNVFSNKTNGKKSECRKIAAYIDTLMLRFGFTRTMLNPIPNMEDATIYRIVGRYTAIISKDKKIYRR